MPVPTPSPAARHAAQLLGSEIRAGRLERGWTVAGLAERAGVAERTVRKVEQGSLSVAVGTVLDCAVLTGVPLFHDDERRLADESARARAAVIGKRVRRPAPPEADLDF